MPLPIPEPIRRRDENGKIRTIFAHSQLYRNVVEIMVLSKDRKQYAKNLDIKLEMVDLPERVAPYPDHGPTLVLDYDIAQEFVDALFAAGVVPTAYRESYRQFDAMHDALKDIKSLMTGGFDMRIKSSIRGNS